MGSLASRPKVPAVQTIYTPVSVAAVTSAPLVDTGSSTATPTDAEQASARRSTSLLERNRGVFSTVLTSFRGILSRNTNAAPRKTLLGE